MSCNTPFPTSLPKKKNFCQDLNNFTSLNSLGETDQSVIWTPRLAFVNALGPYQVLLLLISCEDGEKVATTEAGSLSNHNSILVRFCHD